MFMILHQLISSHPTSTMSGYDPNDPNQFNWAQFALMTKMDDVYTHLVNVKGLDPHVAKRPLMTITTLLPGTKRGIWARLWGNSKHQLIFVHPNPSALLALASFGMEANSFTSINQANEIDGWRYENKECNGRELSRP